MNQASGGIAVHILPLSSYIVLEAEMTQGAAALFVRQSRREGHSYRQKGRVNPHFF